MRAQFSKSILIAALTLVVSLPGCMSDRGTEANCLTIKVHPDSKAWELGRGTYRAQQVHDSVLVFASGQNPTPHYDNILSKSRLTVFPPEISLYHKAPSGIQPQVITPFEICGKFRASEKVDKVTLHDSAGRHEVRVEQVHD